MLKAALARPVIRSRPERHALLPHSNRADSASDFLSFFLFEIAPLFIDLVLAGTYVTAVYGPSLTAVAVVAGGLYLSVAILARPQKIERQTRTVSRSDRVSAYKNESVSNVDLVKYFSAEQYEIGRYIKGYALLQKARLELSFFRRMTDLAETFAMQAGELESYSMMHPHDLPLSL